jgi:hypothetical protein
VIERINEARIHAIGTLVSQLHDLLEEYGNPSYLCTNSQFSFECGCMLYGALYKEMRLAGLLHPYPRAPFPGLGVDVIYRKVRQFRSPQWCDTRRMRYSVAHSCDLGVKVTKIIEKVIRSADGLQLEDSGHVVFGVNL